ncbi:hypothetical protein EGW08_023739 [Elysia chlorotica]|uniref:Reverse transcriptase domain-containing protein n=1 Tax=Elysia chlorotica TaxID=188477 RepID=A0A433SI75_ELYCH|nr:hypothetical protein EGW08_023739 [Elysia chlorotica]
MLSPGTIKMAAGTEGKIRNAWQAREHTVAVLVDLKQAYDRVWRPGLLLKLQQYGVNGRMYNWLKGFLSARYIRTRVNGTYSKSQALRTGLPQGSALSCTLFLCFLNDLSDAIPTFNRLSFADDIALWQSDVDIDRATEALNADLVSLRHYCRRWKMTINAAKTVYAVFSNSREVLAKDLEVKLGDFPLERESLPRYLGLTLDPRLNLTAHVEQLVKKAQDRVSIMRKLAGTSWGSGTTSLRTLYVTFVRPVLEYANPILNLASRTSLEKLSKVQNSALRMVTSGLRSTPITALELATRCEPLCLRREQQTLAAKERYLRFEDHHPLKRMASTFGDVRRRIKKSSFLSTCAELEPRYNPPLNRAPLDGPEWPPDMAPSPIEVKLDLGVNGRKDDTPAQILKAAALECISAFPKEFARCYIDGSASGGVSDGGYGVFIEWGNNERLRESGPVGKSTCSYACERKALARCVQLLKQRNDKGELQGAVILCDCLGLVRKAGTFNPTGLGTIVRTVEDIRNTGTQVACQWIPSHVGIRGNEIADGLANEGRQAPQPEGEHCLADSIQCISTRMSEWWTAEAGINNDERFSRIYEASKTRADDLNALSRGEAIQVFRLRTEHSLLQCSMSKRGWCPMASCRLCGYATESTEHVLFFCPAMRESRSNEWRRQDRRAVLWGAKTAMAEAARLVRVFLQRATN